MVLLCIIRLLRHKRGFKMRIGEIKVGQKVKYENQKWIGIVKDIRDRFNEVAVIFEGDGALEFIDAEYLRAAC